jgi:CHAD domain-containing protein
LKKLQDVLGEFQDAQVQRAALSEFASAMLREQDGAAEALLAMGRLSRELDDRQRQARLGFARRFEAFVSPANARRVAKLNAAGPV